MACFMGKNALYLQSYFEHKVKLYELQTQKKFKPTQEILEEIAKTEKEIKSLLSMFTQKELQEIIIMSLNIE